jgi:hypothetical protein
MRTTLRGIGRIGWSIVLVIAVVGAGLINDELGFWPAIAWLVLVLGAFAVDFGLRLVRR